MMTDGSDASGETSTTLPPPLCPVLTPSDERELAEAVSSTAGPLAVRGGGTRPVGHPVDGDELTVSGLSGITFYEPGALTLVAGAGTPLAQVEATLAAEGQMLAFEPMDHRKLLGTSGEPTIGGTVAANVSGPRRVRAGACRDFLLGVRFVDGRGRIIKNGGRVMKNVTGYDLVRLMAGSRGTLGVLSEVCLKVLPQPESTAVLLLAGLGLEVAVRAMSAALNSPYEVSGAAHVPVGLDGDPVTMIRLEGFEASVAYRAERLKAHLAEFGPAGIERRTEGPESATAGWAWIRDVEAHRGTGEDVWRFSIPPRDAPALVDSLGGTRVVLDWGGGLVWAAVEPGRDARRSISSGHATIVRADDETRIRLGVFQPEAEPLAKFAEGLRRKFDPDGILNPRIDGLMRTEFTEEQLKDPATRRSNEILRSCVHCGFCTATCPTYQVLGDELDSPRGRIYLIKDMLENGRPADERTVRHIDRCLSCLACMTTCPSGVHYMHLVDHARAHIEKTYKRPLFDRLLRWALSRIIPYPGRFRLALLGARLGRHFASLVPEPRLRAMLSMAPKSLPPTSETSRPQTFPAQGERRMRAVLMTGCAQQVLNTDINDATVRLLTRLGCDVVISKGAGCCGALVHHMGRESESHAQAARNIKAWLSGEEPDAVVINTSGCGTTVKDYGHMFRNGPLAEDAARISALAMDVSEVLETLDFPECVPRGIRTAYHAACSLQHGQGVKSAPKDLLKRAGFEVVEPVDSHLCCGSAGTYNLLQPAISDELKIRKVDALEAVAPNLIAAGNIGCMVQIGSGTEVPVVHMVELLDWATGGPRPRAIPETMDS